MNIDEFNDCMDSSKYKIRVKANYDEAVKNGAQSTPTFILISQDGKTEMFAGAQPYSVFAATIESML
jgi:protein-disulfide isomerase